LFGCQ
jgi:hypothetical protein